MINKLLGFYELNSLDIPSVPWSEFTDNTILDPDILWTIRMAVYVGDDLNLPRAVGVSASEAYEFYERHKTLDNNSIIIYYPFFIAIKSGTLQIDQQGFVIEAVEKDLWNLVTHNNRDITVISKDGIERYEGNSSFFTENEIKQLKKYYNIIKRKKSRDLLDNKIFLFEWSLAVKSDLTQNAIGDEFLVFYECRNI